MRPFFSRLSPPSVAAHNAPSASSRNVLTRPSPSPSRARVCRADSAVLEVGHAAVNKSQPQAALHGISDEGTGEVFVSEQGPRNFFYQTISD